jgi:hypothetical protein
VEARLLQGAKETRLIAYRGVVGSTIATIRSFDVPLGVGWLLLLHTDGVSSRFDIHDVPERLQDEPRALADEVLRRWGRPTDDVAVIAVRPNP